MCYIYLHLCVCVYVYQLIFICICFSIDIAAYFLISSYIYMCIFLCVYVYVLICILLYLYFLQDQIDLLIDADPVGSRNGFDLLVGAWLDKKL